MNSKTNDGAPAFAVFIPEERTESGRTTRQEVASCGMSLRAYIATAALEGYLSSFAIDGCKMPSPEKCAVESVAYADALIAELEKKP